LVLAPRISAQRVTKELQVGLIFWCALLSQYQGDQHFGIGTCLLASFRKHNFTISFQNLTHTTDSSHILHALNRFLLILSFKSRDSNHHTSHLAIVARKHAPHLARGCSTSRVGCDACRALPVALVDGVELEWSHDCDLLCRSIGVSSPRSTTGVVAF
jgi:hypothetical protein